MSTSSVRTSVQQLKKAYVVGTFCSFHCYYTNCSQIPTTTIQFHLFTNKGFKSAT